MVYAPADTCLEPGCDLPVKRNVKGHGQGRCSGHYGQRNGRFLELGDRYTDRNGYIRVKTESGVLLEHRIIMEGHLGRQLTRGETVHHINGNRSDNRLENLELWYSAQPYGQRVTQLLQYAVRHHRAEIETLLAAA